MNLLTLLELVQRRDGGADGTVVDLLDWLKVPDGWAQNTTIDDQPVDEVIMLNIDETSIDALAVTLQDIDKMIKAIERARDPREPFGVWLRTQLYGESQPRLAYLTRGKRSPQVRVSSPSIEQSALLQYTLGLTRMGAWEADDSAEISAVSPVSAHGGTIAYTLPGDMPARAAITAITAGDGYTSFNEVWLGIKSYSESGVTPANFVPFWGINDRSMTGADSSATSDANAVSGYHLTVTFGTTTSMATRFGIPVTNITANPDDQRGKYVVLARCMTDDSSLVVNLRGGQGYAQSTTLRSLSYGDSVQIATAASSYHYYNLGLFDLPPAHGLFDVEMNYAALLVQAEKVSGSGNLLIDGLLLIPAEHFVHVRTTQLISTSQNYTLYVLTRPNLQYQAMVTTAYIVAETTIEEDVPDQLTWTIPPGSGILVVGAQSSSATAVGDVIDPVLTVYPSFATLRGAGT